MDNSPHQSHRSVVTQGFLISPDLQVGHCSHRAISPHRTPRSGVTQGYLFSPDSQFREVTQGYLFSPDSQFREVTQGYLTSPDSQVIVHTGLPHLTRLADQWSQRATSPHQTRRSMVTKGYLISPESQVKEVTQIFFSPHQTHRSV